eukprot:TRINITY_DN3849_c1_g1_i1.p1 TRINITY_DN3849_c1_g1~~TRINITY_DN3849_c1_g1_i1.p1  ORF type:complete len:438 (-),score=159.07 TRINITY_DN3849_c1_g1_i1:136-1449(-)
MTAVESFLTKIKDRSLVVGPISGLTKEKDLETLNKELLTTDLISIDFSNQLFSTSDLKKIADGLLNQKNLNEIKLESVDFEKETSDILRILLDNLPNLQKFYIECIEDAPFLCSHLSNSSNCANIVELNLTNTSIDKEGAIELSKIIKNPASKIEKLILEESKVEEGIIEIGQAIGNNNTIKELNINYNSLSYELMTQFLSAIIPNTSLTNLYLNANSIKTAEPFCSALKTKSNLKRLSIAATEIQGEGCPLIFKALSFLPLEFLSMHHNPIGRAGAGAISYLLKHTTSLREIICSVCRFSDEELEEIIPGLIENATLTKFDFSLNQIKEAGTVKLFTALKSNIYLEELHASKCVISTVSTKSLVDIISSCPQIRKIFAGFSGGKLDHSTTLVQALPASIGLVEFLIGGNELNQELVDRVKVITSNNQRNLDYFKSF